MWDKADNHLAYYISITLPKPGNVNLTILHWSPDTANPAFFSRYGNDVSNAYGCENQGALQPCICSPLKLPTIENLFRFF